MNYQSLYEWGVQELLLAKIEEAKWDARLLLEEVCHTDRNTLLVHGEREVSPKEEATYREWIQKRKAHIPLQHLTGYQEFMGLRFKVTNEVLIPRQDTEILVEEVMRFLHDGMRILDLCTGSGCILLSLLNYSNDCIGTGIDISEPALQIARENAEELGITAQLFQSDLFERVEGKFEYIVSNPPYIRTAEIEALQEEVKNHDPRLALDGGVDGLDFYQRIIEEAPGYLCSGGMLFLEIGYDEADAVSTIMKNRGFLEVQTCKDFAGLDRVIYGTWEE